MRVMERQPDLDVVVDHCAKPDIAGRLSKRWGKAFENLYREPPNWYQPANPGDFTTWMLVNDIDRSIWSMNQTFPSQPRVSTDGSGSGAGYSWSSGGFGGGGSSGGGFGGGGGSSW